MATTKKKCRRPTHLRVVRHRTNDLNREAWVRWLEMRLRVSEVPLTDSDVRSLYRWRHQGDSPTVFTADALLCRYRGALGLIYEFETYCEEQGISMWATGVTPAWWLAEDELEVA